MPTDTAIQFETETEFSLQVADVKRRPLTQEKTAFQHIFATRRGLNTPEATSADPDTGNFKKLLGKHEAARQRAQAAAAEAQKQLQLAEAENKRVRVELKRAQNELELSKQEHSFELRRAVEREACLWNDLVEVRGNATKALDRASGYKKILIGVLVLLVLPVMIWAAVSYRHVPAAQVAQAEPAGDPFATISARMASGGEQGNTVGKHDFSENVKRLDQALSQFTDVKPEDVLQRVHAAYAARGKSVCSFEWNNGQISLVFGPEPGMGVGTVMAQCADAVERSTK